MEMILVGPNIKTLTLALDIPTMIEARIESTIGKNSTC